MLRRTPAYDATNVLLKATDDAGTDDPAKVAKKLEEMSFSVVSGDISYDAQHNPVKGAAVLRVIGGEVKHVTTVSP